MRKGSTIANIKESIDGPRGKIEGSSDEDDDPEWEEIGLNIDQSFSSQNRDLGFKIYEKEEKSIFRDCLAYLSLHDPLLNSQENESYTQKPMNSWKALLNQAQNKRNSLTKLSSFDRPPARLQIPRVNIERSDILIETIPEAQQVSNFAKKSKSQVNLLINAFQKKKEVKTKEEKLNKILEECQKKGIKKPYITPLSIEYCDLPLSHIDNINTINADLQIQTRCQTTANRKFRMKNIFSEKRSSPLLRQRKQLAPTFLALSQRAREQFSIPPRIIKTPDINERQQPQNIKVK